VFIAAGLVMAVAGGAPGMAAQEAAPSYPASILAGSCASPGDAVATLTPLLVPEGEVQGPDGATPVAQSVTDVALMVPDMTGSSHAVMVYGTAEQGGGPILCGEIGGVVGEDGSLTIGLQAMNGGKGSGTASFVPTRKSDGTTVTVLFTDERRERERAGEAADSSSDAAGGATANEDGAGGGRDGAGTEDGSGNVEVPAGSDEVLGLEDVARLNPNVAEITGVNSQPGGHGIVDRPGRDDIGDNWRDRKGKGGNGPARAGEDGKSSN
jgi:hypothetical protein